MGFYPHGATALLAAWVACAAPPARTPDAAAEDRMSLRLTVATDRDTYHSGDSVHVTLTVANAGADTAVLRFATGQRYDVAILAGDGRSLWRWSHGMAFMQVLGVERVPPGDSLVYRERVLAPAEPGRYAVEGRVPTTESELVDRADISVASR